MIAQENKPLLKKDICELKFNNHEKQQDIYSTFHRLFNKKSSKTILKSNKFDNNNQFLISLLKSKIFTKQEKKFCHNHINYNSYSPYVTKMISNAANLVKYNYTKYLPKEISCESLYFSNDKNKKKNLKTFFGVESNTPLNLDDNECLSLRTHNTKYSIKTPSSVISLNKNEKSKILFTKEDEILANKIFQYKNKNKEIKENKENEEKDNDDFNEDNEEEINSFFEKYSIDKNLSNDEKMKIKKIMKNNAKYANKKFFTINSLNLSDYSNNFGLTKTKSLIKKYRNPYHSLENLKFNSQIQEAVEKIRDNLQYQKYQDQFNVICNLKISNNRMPKIIVLNKQNLVERMDILKKKYATNYFKKHKYNVLNKKKIKDISVLKSYKYLQNNNEEEKDKLSYEERIKKVRLEIWHLGFSYHPESRTMSSVCYDFEDKRLYNYGGIGGIIYGDIWECKCEENKLGWKKIYSYKYEKNEECNKYNAPLPRYGHTCHFYKKKIFVIGGEYKDWKRDFHNEDIIWIFDIEKKEWNNLRKYEAKVKSLAEKRNSQQHFFKLKKSFSDVTLKIPIVISPVLDNFKESKKKVHNLNKPLYEKYKKEGKRIYKKLYPCIRRNHVSILIGSHIFLYGGINQNKEILNDCWIYDIKSLQWAMIQGEDKSPPSLGHHCGCLAIEKDNLINDTFNFYHKPKNINGTVDLLKIDGVFFFGGINIEKKPSNLLFHMSIGTKPVVFDIPKINGKPPKARFDASMDFSQDISMIIIYGGKNEFEVPSYFGDMTLLDLRTMNWIQPNFYKEKLTQRAQHLSIVIGDDLIIFGGTTGNELLNYDFTVVDLNIFNK